jgi:hypothetical protein
MVKKIFSPVEQTLTNLLSSYESLVHILFNGLSKGE